ncbi:MAG: HAD-IIA family hydrolase [Ruminococcaceae bacterium]|nr:HAD-IIA family hydrolase [Oscillospiraceae bacterium]
MAGNDMKLENKKFFLLDMDGTIYLDNDVFDGTYDFLDKVIEKGGKYLFVTNNSSKSVDAYVEKLTRLGIKADIDSFLTSTDATILYLKANYPGKRFYAMGTASFIKQLVDAGIDVVTDLCDNIFGIVISNDNELTFKKLDDVCRLLTNGVEAYIATNPDWVCPTAFGYVPDCGSFAWMLEKATGKKPHFIGKPRPEMLTLAMEKYGYTKEESLMVGDRVYTDIASGYNAGIDTVFVLSGEGTLEDAENTDTKPTYIMQNIRELYNNI